MGRSFMPHALVFFLLISSMTMKPSRFRWAIWPLIASLGYILFLSNPTNDPGVDAPLRSILLTYMFIASDYIVLTDVQNELRRPSQHEPISTSSFWARLHWALRLFANARGVGWDHEPKGVLPPRPRFVRGRFIISQIFKLAFFLVLLDLVNTVVASTSIFTKDSIPTASQPLHWRVFGIFLFATGSVASLSIVHIMLSIIGVGTGISESQSWPPLFGNWTEAYTLRTFWGRTWHQNMRRLVSSHGKHLVRRLCLPAGSKASCLVQLYTAFVISGIIHIHPSDTRPLYFFTVQAFAITFEDIVIAVATKAGFTAPTKMHKILGFTWVVCWFTFSIPKYMDSLIDSGMLKAGPRFDIGIVSRVIRYIGPVIGYMGFIPSR